MMNLVYKGLMPRIESSAALVIVVYARNISSSWPCTTPESASVVETRILGRDIVLP